MIINPGSGPVVDANRADAERNMAVFVGDLVRRGHDAHWQTAAADKGEGRWSFQVFVDGTWHEVAMPGLPVDRVRYLGTDEQRLDPWDYPRLYIDGSSWLWKFALNVIGHGPDE